MSYASNNPVVGANNRSKRAEIPVTITCSNVANSITIAVDSPFVGVAECVNSPTDATTTPVNTLDTTNVLTGLTKASTGSACFLGFTVLDSVTEAPSGSVPSAGYSATATPAVGGSARGTASFLRSAKLGIGEAASGSLTAGNPGVGQMFVAQRAALGGAGVTANGNLQIKLMAPPAGICTTTATATTLATAGLAVLKGNLELVWD